MLAKLPRLPLAVRAVLERIFAMWVLIRAEIGIGDGRTVKQTSQTKEHHLGQQLCQSNALLRAKGPSLGVFLPALLPRVITTMMPEVRIAGSSTRLKTVRDGRMITLFSHVRMCSFDVAKV
jgi:hypothetical protein